MNGALLAADAAKEFIFAGHAIVTVVSKKTGMRFTYKITRAEDETKHLWFVALLSGPDNTSNYSYMGIIRDGIFRSTAKSRISVEAPSFKAFAWSFNHLDSPLIEVWHEGSCGRCGRLLTVPESIARGIGPDCAGPVLAAHRSETA